MTKKLYEVHVLHKAYVLADDERDAEGYAREIANNEDREVEVYEVTRGNPLGWFSDSLVYHDGPEHIEVGSVLPND